jgi:hypothetical protein
MLVTQGHLDATDNVSSRANSHDTQRNLMKSVIFLRARSLRTVFAALSLIGTVGLISASGATTAPTPRAELSAAIAAGNAQHYVRIVSVNTSPGASQQVSSQAGPGTGTQFLTNSGSGGSGEMFVIYVNHILFVKASLGFLEGTFGLTKGAATPVTNKWASVATSNPAYGNVFSAVTIKSAMSYLAYTGTVTAGGTTVVNGIKVKVLRVAIGKSSVAPAGTETLYIALTGPPLPIAVNFVGSGYSSKLTFSQWGKRFTLHAPTSSLRMPSAQAG